MAQLERAFANLLQNALRHSGDQVVSVRARASGGRVLVRVVDRGPGISRADQERIFEPFFRAGDDRTGGSGLGLAIVKGFCRGQRRRGAGGVAAGPGDEFRGNRLAAARARAGGLHGILMRGGRIPMRP